MQKYEHLLKEYPEHITKDQFYRIIKSSKRTALFYIQLGLIPAIDSGKKTRRYKIATKDVVEFLNEREKDPIRFKVDDGWYQKSSRKKSPPRHVVVPLDSKTFTKEKLERWLESYPDILNVSEVAQITGYVSKTVIEWCSSGVLFRFLVNRTFLIPKVSLIEYLVSENFTGVKVERDKYDLFWEQFQK